MKFENPILLPCYLRAWITNAAWGAIPVAAACFAGWHFVSAHFIAGLMLGLWLMGLHNIAWAWLVRNKKPKRSARPVGHGETPEERAARIVNGRIFH
jgi:hypothetical protein